MLVLSRTVDEAVVVDGPVRVVVVAVRGRSVRLGFEAAADVKIDREERLRRADGDRKPP